MSSCASFSLESERTCPAERCRCVDLPIIACCKDIRREGSMLLRTAWCSLILLLLLHVRATFGLPKDSGLVQLVPPQSSLIAGMTNSAAQGTTKSFLLVTHE